MADEFMVPASPEALLDQDSDAMGLRVVTELQLAGLSLEDVDSIAESERCKTAVATASLQ